MRGQATLTSIESKMLIAKGVAAMKQVKDAMENHSIILAGGTTNAFIAEELLGVKFERETNYTVGVITEGKTGLSPEEKRVAPFVITKGVQRSRDYHWKEYLPEAGPGDVFIKGGNAVDHTGLAGVFASNLTGGTIGAAWGTLIQRGVTLIVPIGLEKLIPDVRTAVELTARKQTDKSIGDRVALMPLLGGITFTEIDALKTLFNLDAACIGAGGINGSEGSVTLVFDGDEESANQAFALIDDIKSKNI